MHTYLHVVVLIDAIVKNETCLYLISWISWDSCRFFYKKTDCRWYRLYLLTMKIRKINMYC